MVCTNYDRNFTFSSKSAQFLEHESLSTVLLVPKVSVELRSTQQTEASYWTKGMFVVKPVGVERSDGSPNVAPVALSWNCHCAGWRAEIELRRSVVLSRHSKAVTGTVRASATRRIGDVSPSIIITIIAACRLLVACCPLLYSCFYDRAAATRKNRAVALSTVTGQFMGASQRCDVGGFKH